MPYTEGMNPSFASRKERLLRFLLDFKIEEGQSRYLERVRVFALYIILITAWAGGGYNFFLNWGSRDQIALIYISLFLVFLTLAVAAFWKTRTLRASQWLVALAILIIIAHIVINAGGGRGLGVFYLLAATPVFFLTLGFRNSLIIAVLYFIGIAIRLHLGHFEPESIFQDGELIQRTLVILGIGSFLGVFSTLGLQFYHTRINHLAYQDQLTLMANRTKFEEVLIAETLDARKAHRGFTLLGIKLLNYNSINANLSTRKGDEIIRETAVRLKEGLQNSVITGRWSGSLFLTILNTVNLAELQDRCRLIKGVMEKPVQIERSSINLPFSLAVCRFPDDAVSPGQLLSNMMSIFDRGKNIPGEVTFFNEEQLRKERQRFIISETLKEADLDKEFTLYYQPKIRSSDGGCTGAEVLLRWNSTRMGPVSPAQFITVAEESGYIRLITRWILKRSFSDLKQVQTLSGTEGLVHAINLSVMDLKDPEFLPILQALITEEAVDPRRFEFELTEGMLIDENPQIRETLEGLTRMGFRLAIDDFGTGYSSLSYLNTLKVHNIKIDQSFTQQITEHSGRGYPVVDAIISMGLAMGLEITAEGVETETQFQYLKNRGCQIIQGWLFSRALSLDNYMIYLTGESYEEEL